MSETEKNSEIEKLIIGESKLRQIANPLARIEKKVKLAKTLVKAGGQRWISKSGSMPYNGFEPLLDPEFTKNALIEILRETQEDLAAITKLLEVQEK